MMPAQPGGDTGGAEPVLAGRQRAVRRLPWMLALSGIQAAFAHRMVWSSTAFQDEVRYQCWLRPAAL